jgi:hypothetical protein
MARVLLPHFVFLWVPSSEKQAIEEEFHRQNAYQNGMKLFNKDLCKHDFVKIESFNHLIKTLEYYGGNKEDEDEDHGYVNRFKPIFILTGHGQTNTGYMGFLKPGDGALVPRRLTNNWRPRIPCDFIATQCYSHSFLDFVTNPCLMGLDSVRWISAGTSASPSTQTVIRIDTTGKVAFHIELMRLLETYLLSYPELIEPDTNQCNSVRKTLDSILNSIFVREPPTPTTATAIAATATPTTPTTRTTPPSPRLPGHTNSSPKPKPNDHGTINPHYIVILLLMVGSMLGTPVIVGLLFLYYVVIPRVNIKKLLVFVVIDLLVGIPIWFLYIVDYLVPTAIEKKYHKMVDVVIIVFVFVYYFI